MTKHSIDKETIQFKMWYRTLQKVKYGTQMYEKHLGKV